MKESIFKLDPKVAAMSIQVVMDEAVKDDYEYVVVVLPKDYSTAHCITTLKGPRLIRALNWVCSTYNDDEVTELPVSDETVN